MKLELDSKTTFITFYSFKGGVGRSMALINTAGILAGQRGFHVLVLDLDLEAPGLSYLNPESPEAAGAEVQRELPLQHGFVDLLTDAKEKGQDGDLFKLSDAELEAKYTRKIKIPEVLRKFSDDSFSDGSLHIMPAGRSDHNYSQRLDALNLNALYREGIGEPLIRAFKKKLSESGRYDYVLVDSRTGISEGAGICTRDLADHVMVLSGLNRQNIEGTSEFLREFRAATEGKKSFQVILSPMPNGEDKLAEERRGVAQQRFAEASRQKLELSLEIPYHPQLALTEEPHIFRSHRGYLFEAYRTIESQMLDALGHNAQTIVAAVEQRLAHGEYHAGLRFLQRMLRFAGSKEALSRLATRLLIGGLRRPQAQDQSTESELNVDKIFADEYGRQVIDLIVDNMAMGEENQRTLMLLVLRLEELSPASADRIYKRLVAATPLNVDNFITYASFLERQERFDEAESVYKRAIETDPKDASILVNFAIFLRRQGKFDEAENLHKRAVEADLKSAYTMASYAAFLQWQGRLMEAEPFYRGALEVEPKSSHSLGNYGQLLAGISRFEEGTEKLLQAFGHLARLGDGDVAEICLALWLIKSIEGRTRDEWLCRFKFLIERGFKRHEWSFEPLLKQAKSVLSSDDFDYAKALVAAFLDETKVAELSKYPQWVALEPLSPETPLTKAVDA